MTGLDWQDPDPDAFDPENPLTLLEKAAAAESGSQAMQAVWAVRCMATAGADAGVMAVARDFVKRRRLLPLASFDDIVRQARGGSPSAADAGERAPAVATLLVEIARELYTFGVSDLGEAFAVPNEGSKVVAMLRGSKTSLRALLAREAFSRTGRAPTQQALADALLVIEGIAQDAAESRLFLRTAQNDGELWLDLGDTTGRAVKVTARGWSVQDEPPVLFKRTSLTSPLPEPRRGGSIAELWSWLNVKDDDRPLIAAALVHALFSDQPHVILAIFGEHGTAKTTALKILVQLIDPSPVLARKPPRDADSWVVQASGSWVVGLDNLSEIPDWLSDALCRASTGDGDVRRKLYTDGDYAVFAFRRFVIFDGIDVGTLQPDLADRMIPVTLELIADSDRKDEQSFWAGWAAAHPQLLGAVLDLAARVLARLPGLDLERKPRMADFAKVLAAVDAEMGTSALERYSISAASLAAESLSGNAFAARMLDAIAETFEGSSAALLSHVTPADEAWRPGRDWPKNSRAVTGAMRRLAPAFRKTGWLIDELPAGHDNAIRWRISPPPQPEKPCNDTREPSQASPGGTAASNASERERSSRTSTSKPKTERACPRHASTGFGPHKHCLDCLDPSSGGTS